MFFLWAFTAFFFVELVAHRRTALGLLHISFQSGIFFFLH